jgi:branched-chain amino acid aminotransferase
MVSGYVLLQNAHSLLQMVNEDVLITLIKKLITLDKHWVPKEAGYSLYVRPTMSE